MRSGNGWFYPIVGFISCLAFLYISFGDLWISVHGQIKLTFVERNGTQFLVDGKPFYFNGWNSYWMMDHAVDEYNRHKIRAMLLAGSKMGLTVCRTWAFSDGGYNALQISPGRFNEKVFRALDFVIAESGRYGIRLVLCLVNNLQAYGGKTQYVKWAWEEGVALSSSNDSFFYDTSIRRYFKNYVKAVLTRKNTLTGVEYRNDPTILAWELINEPRCMTDKSGDTLQSWIEEMSGFVKLIDQKHLLTVGLEGFYGPTSPKRFVVNPEVWAADFERISFATRRYLKSILLLYIFIRITGECSHISTSFGSDSASFFARAEVELLSNNTCSSYQCLFFNLWFVVRGRTQNPDFEHKLKFVFKWMFSHIEDGDKELNKPILFTEFGFSTLNKDFSHSKRERLYKLILDVIYRSAQRNKSEPAHWYGSFSSMEWRISTMTLGSSRGQGHRHIDSSLIIRAVWRNYKAPFLLRCIT